MHESLCWEIYEGKQRLSLSFSVGHTTQTCGPWRDGLVGPRNCMSNGSPNNTHGVWEMGSKKWAWSWRWSAYQPWAPKDSLGCSGISGHCFGFQSFGKKWSLWFEEENSLETVSSLPSKIVKHFNKDFFPSPSTFVFGIYLLEAVGSWTPLLFSNIKISLNLKMFLHWGNTH